MLLVSVEQCQRGFGGTVKLSLISGGMARNSGTTARINHKPKHDSFHASL